MTNTIAGVISSLPPGFTFDPTDMQLLLDYLKPKNLGQLPGHYLNMLPEVDVLESEPWELHSRLSHMFSSNKLFFFCRLKTKSRWSIRYDRATKAGYWKMTGQVSSIMSEDTGAKIGEKRLLVFYIGRMPNGIGTSWVMHEYRLDPKCLGDDHDKNKALPYVACWIKNNKDKKAMRGHAPPPVNQEGDHLSFRDNQHNEVVAAHPEMSVGELTESLLQSRPLNAMSSDYTTLVHQPQPGAEHASSSLPGFSRGNDGTGLDFGLLLSPDGDHTLYPNYCQKCFEAYLHFECIKRQS